MALRDMRRMGWLVLAVGLLLGAAEVQAGVTLSPSRVVLRGKPKKVLTGFFTVENPDAEPLTIIVEPEDWARGIGGARGPVPWLAVKPARLTLAPGRSARVKFTVRIPKDASGELRSQVFFTSSAGGKGSVPLKTRVGAILYVAIEGGERIEGSLTRVEGFYTASTPGVAKPDRLEIVLHVHNASNVHVVPEGRIVVRNAEGLKAAATELPAGWGLLPNQEDLYHAVGHGIHLKPGRYTVEVTLNFGGDLSQPTTLTNTFSAEVTEAGQWRFLSSP